MSVEVDDAPLHPAAGSPTSKPRRRWFSLRLILVAWLFMKMVGCYGLFPGPWGPSVGGPLPNGHAVWYRSYPLGRETNDQLLWQDAHGVQRELWVQRYHAGAAFVTFRYKDGGNRVWVENDVGTLASLDLTTGEFQDELSVHHPWAIQGEGQILDAGRAFNLLWLIGPW